MDMMGCDELKAITGRTAATGNQAILTRQPRRKWMRRHDALGNLGMALIIGIAGAWAYVILEVMKITDAANDSGHAASWTQAMLSVITLAVTTAFLLAQVRIQTASRAHEVDDDLYRSVATFVLMAHHLLERVRSKNTPRIQGTPPHLDEFYLLDRLRQAPFYSFPDERTLKAALAVIDCFQDALQIRTAEYGVFERSGIESKMSLEKSIRTIEMLLGEITAAVSDWAPKELASEQARRVRKAVARHEGL